LKQNSVNLFMDWCALFYLWVSRLQENADAQILPNGDFFVTAIEPQVN
jgi:hypothetical protein